MTNLTSAEQAQRIIDWKVSNGHWTFEDTVAAQKLAQDYISVLAERDRLRAELANCQRDLAAGVEQGKAAIEAYRKCVNLLSEAHKLAWPWIHMRSTEISFEEWDSLLGRIAAAMKENK